MSEIFQRLKGRKLKTERVGLIKTLIDFLYILHGSPKDSMFFTLQTISKVGSHDTCVF